MSSSRFSIKSTPLKEHLFFFKRWLENPLQLGAILPSSRPLGKLVARHVMEQWKRSEPSHVIELGAGTGSFTQSLLDEGFPPELLICVELDPQLCAYLKNRFPKVHVLQGDATQLTSLVKNIVKKPVSLIVSGVPMLSISEKERRFIVESSFRVLGETGKFFQFTYYPFSPIAVRKYALEKKRIGTIFRNIPPATVWCYEKKISSSLST